MRYTSKWYLRMYASVVGIMILLTGTGVFAANEPFIEKREASPS